MIRTLFPADRRRRPSWRHSNEEGATAAEYAIMLALIIGAVISAVNAVGGSTADKMSSNASRIATATGAS